MSFYTWFYKTFEPFVSWLYRIDAHGVENIPDGGAILASNHTSFSDVLVISAASKRQVRYMAKKELFKTPLAPLIKALGAFSRRPRRSGRKKLKYTISLIEERRACRNIPAGSQARAERTRAKPR